jgi:cytochrome c553
MKGETVQRDSSSSPQRSAIASLATAAILFLLLPLVFGASSFLLQTSAPPVVRIPSNIEWTSETMARASGGDAFHGMLLARRCDHCHGAEGFSPAVSTPNLAGIDRPSIWKQLQDFRTQKRISPVMQPIASSLSERDVADVAAYYSMLPNFPDPQDNRSFPQSAPETAHVALASRLVSTGDGERGIPPCQACHGPVAYRTGAPALSTQNSDYILRQLEKFANNSRSNDINMPMRAIAGLLTEEEKHALAEYYGSGLGLLPAGATAPR